MLVAVAIHSSLFVGCLRPSLASIKFHSLLSFWLVCLLWKSIALLAQRSCRHIQYPVFWKGNTTNGMGGKGDGGEGTTIATLPVSFPH